MVNYDWHNIIIRLNCIFLLFNYWFHCNLNWCIGNIQIVSQRLIFYLIPVKITKSFFCTLICNDKFWVLWFQIDKIYKKIPLLMFWFNRKLDNRGLFPYFQYINKNTHLIGSIKFLKKILVKTLWNYGREKLVFVVWN